MPSVLKGRLKSLDSFNANDAEQGDLPRKPHFEGIACKGLIKALANANPFAGLQSNGSIDNGSQVRALMKS